MLASFPLVGPPYPRGTSGKIREIVCWSYRIFYRATPERKLIEILTIWHGARGTPIIRR
jgi:plasmid stabilization system protein ParE